MFCEQDSDLADADAARRHGRRVTARKPDLFVAHRLHFTGRLPFDQAD